MEPFGAPLKIHNTGKYKNIIPKYNNTTTQNTNRQSVPCSYLLLEFLFPVLLAQRGWRLLLSAAAEFIAANL